MDTNENYRLPHDFLTKDHDIESLVKEIEANFIPLSQPLDREQRFQRRVFFMNIRSQYTKARYIEYPTHEDFCQLFSFVEKQRGILISELTKEKTPRHSPIATDMDDNEFQCLEKRE